MEIKTWSPLLGLKEPSQVKISKSMALIILNQPITDENGPKMVRLLHNSAIKFCVDGGTNRLYKWHTENDSNAHESNEYVPDYICGDLDSIDESIKAYYVNKGKY